MAYQWILFDLDDTLFDFPAADALRAAFAHYSATLSADMLADYQSLNRALWEQYNAGLIDVQTLKQARFRELAPHLGVSPLELNQRFMQAILERSQPLNGVQQTLQQLQGRVKMGIITNGFTSLQQTRLERTGLRDHFDLLIISEQVGVAKPDARIFDYALAQAGNPPRSRVLMVGDTAESDIRGGVNAGLATCWLNAHQRELPADLEPDWTVTSLSELEQLLCKH